MDKELLFFLLNMDKSLRFDKLIADDIWSFCLLQDIKIMTMRSEAIFSLEREGWSFFTNMTGYP